MSPAAGAGVARFVAAVPRAHSADSGSPGPIHLFGLVDREPDLKHQRRDRIAQLMRDRGDELVAGGDRALQFLRFGSDGAVGSSVGQRRNRRRPRRLSGGGVAASMSG